MCGRTGHSLRYLACLVEILFQLMSPCQGNGELSFVQRPTSSISAVSSSILDGRIRRCRYGSTTTRALTVATEMTGL